MKRANARSRRREQECHRPDRNDRDERRMQWALVPVVDQGELSTNPHMCVYWSSRPSSLQEVWRKAHRDHCDRDHTVKANYEASPYQPPGSIIPVTELKPGARLAQRRALQKPGVPPRRGRTCPAPPAPALTAAYSSSVRSIVGMAERLLSLCHRKRSIQRRTAALSPSVTYIIPIITSPLNAGLSVSGCVLRSDAMLATACARSPASTYSSARLLHHARCSSRVNASHWVSDARRMPTVAGSSRNFGR